MADADEDAIRPLDLTDPENADNDVEDDGAVDFRLLASLSNKTGALPKRGLKDFEPDPTQKQADVLTASRDAMHDALDYTRFHAPKGHVIAFYFPHSGRTIVPRPKGNFFKTLGAGMSGGGVELLPEEALWALERGSLDVHYAGDALEAQADQLTAEDTMPLSLQSAYAVYLSDERAESRVLQDESSPLPDNAQTGTGLTLDKYVVFAGLKRAGYIVMRADGFDNLRRKRQIPQAAVHTPQYRLPLTSYLQSFIKPSAPSNGQRAQGPLIKPGIYRSYNDIFALLSHIPAHHPSSLPGQTPYAPKTLETPYYTPFLTTWALYKPAPTFRKSEPGPPSFTICVVNAQTTHLPSLSELSDFLDDQQAFYPRSSPTSAASTNDLKGLPISTTSPYINPQSVPEKLQSQFGAGGVNARLKHGHANVILAVVDQGLVSYMRISEMLSIREKVYEVAAARGGKGGGRGRGRGRGRGGRR